MCKELEILPNLHVRSLTCLQAPSLLEALFSWLVSEGFSLGPRHTAVTSACSGRNSGSVAILTSQLWVPSQSQSFQPGRKQRRNVQALHPVDNGVWLRDEDGDATQIPVPSCSIIRRMFLGSGCSLSSFRDFPCHSPLSCLLFSSSTDVRPDVPPWANSLRRCPGHPHSAWPLQPNQRLHRIHSLNLL